MATGGAVLLAPAAAIVGIGAGIGAGLGALDNKKSSKIYFL